jgi:hypothetical protein
MTTFGTGLARSAARSRTWPTPFLFTPWIAGQVWSLEEIAALLD